MDLQPYDDPQELFDRLSKDPRIGRVTVHLRGGTSLTGTIGPIGDESVVIKALTGREYFDAWVRFDSVVSVEVQTRA